MPLYEFACTKCKIVYEKIQRYSDQKPACKKCGEETKRLISKTSFMLKGRGWGSDGYEKIGTWDYDEWQPIIANENGQPSYPRWTEDDVQYGNDDGYPGNPSDTSDE